MSVSVFVRDTMTGTGGTNLTAHSPEVGSSWARVTGFTGDWSLDGAGGAYNSSSAAAAYYNAAAPGDTDWRIEIELHVYSVLGAETWALLLNADSGGTYWYNFFWSANTLTLLRRETSINVPATSGTLNLSAGTTYTIVVARTAGVLTCTNEGADVFSPYTDASPLAHNGNLAFYHAQGSPDSTTSTGIHIDNVIGGPSPGVPPGNIIAVTDTHPIWDPISWVSISGQRYTTQMGAMVRTGWTGTDFGIETDTTQYGGITPLPKIAYSIDGGPWTDYQLTSSTAAISLASGLASGTHSIRVLLKQIDYTLDAWTTPNNALRIKNWRTNVSEALTTPTGVLALQSKIMLELGDSRIPGVKVNSAVNPSGNDGTLTIGRSIASGVGAECGLIAYPGQGLLNAGGTGSNVPKAYSATATAAARSLGFYNATDGTYISGGALVVQPDYIILGWAANDGDTAVDATYQTGWQDMLALVRGWCPSAWLFALIYDGQRRVPITAAVTAFADAKCKVIDMADTEGVTSSGTATINSLDGLHYSAVGVPRVVGAVVGEIRRLTATGGGLVTARGFTGGYPG